MSAGKRCVLCGDLVRFPLGSSVCVPGVRCTRQQYAGKAVRERLPEEIADIEAARFENRGQSVGDQ
jgi:hypothetical protein